ncbi:GntR family transcriptional regulator [Ruegeria sp. R14_0]|uniref:GntR family transcriptional regulator n=1 Tax=Ruegeria sp. R14_0 TaxID=2821100 RepID=UPI001ADCDE32|nr:GntR family transcriptional regulator [Ruegeria sp. R14_0]MBO9445782.1 GntR family transcriptional regulator [Ruegeria sp. R14_0]
MEILPTQRGTRKRIADAIRTDIMRGTLRFGQRIPESEYMSKFGVSRTPVREATLSLSTEGLVQIRAQAGSWVIDLNKERLRKLFVARRLLEMAGVQGASRKERETLASDLESLTPDLYRPVESATSYDAFNDVDTEFHRRLVAASGNEFLLQAYQPVMVCSMAARSRLEKSSVVSEQANDHHGRILTALQRNDLADLENTLAEHFDWVFSLLLQVPEILED